MKRSDIAVIILLVSLSLMFGYFVGGAVFSKNEPRTEKVQAAEAITAEVQVPDGRIFNEKAINPTVQVNIGESANQKPFDRN